MGIRITDLASASTVGLTDTFVLVQNGTTKKCTASQVKTTDASELISGTLNSARLPVVPILTGGTGATDAISALSAIGGQNSSQIIALTTLQLNSITFSAGTGLVGGGTLAANRTFALETTGVSAGTFGSSTQIPVLTVDNKGRVTSIQNVTPLPGNNASDLTVGTLDPNRLATSGAVAGTYGSNSIIGQFTVDSKGRITSATNVGISGSAGGTVVSVGATSSTLAISNSPITYSGALQLELSTTGVSAITAGSSTQSAVITVDTYGRVTSLQTQSIAALFPTGVAAGTYGAQNKVGSFSVDVNGVMTGATEQVISIAASQVLSGLASAQITGISAAQVAAGITSAQISGISAAQIGSGLTSAQITGISAAQVSVGISSAQISGISAAQVGSGLTSAQIGVLSSSQISGISAAQVASGITSAQITSLSAAQIGTGLTSAQITGISVTQVGSLGTGVATFLQNPSSSNLISAVTDETGTGSLVFGSSPIISSLTVNGYTEGVVNVGSPVGASATLSITAGTVLTATLTSATPCTFTMPAVGAGKSFTLYLKQPATGTATTATFTNVVWPAGGVPVITATLGRMDILSFVSDGVKWYGNFVQNFIY